MVQFEYLRENILSEGRKMLFSAVSVLKVQIMDFETLNSYYSTATEWIRQTI